MIFSSGTFSVVATGDGTGSVNFEASGNTVSLSLSQAQQAAFAIASGLATGLVDTTITVPTGQLSIQGNSLINPPGTTFSWNRVELANPGVNIVIIVFPGGTPLITYLTESQAWQLANALGRYLVTYQ
jgi:hypothetical protein